MNRADESLSPDPCSSGLLSSPPFVGHTSSSLDLPLSSSTPTNHQIQSSLVADSEAIAEKRGESLCDPEIAWNLDSTLEGKNPLSVISDEDMITLQSVLSSEEGKKILQETSLPGIENRNDSMQEIANDSKNEDKSVVGVTEPEVNIQLELDDETTSQILKEGIKESVLVDFVANFADHAYSAPLRTVGDSVVESADVTSELEKTDSFLEDPNDSNQLSPNSQERRAIRRSTRIQDQEQREMAEKIRMENIQAERAALGQDEENKPDSKKYNMRTKRPIRDDGRIDYTIRRTKKKETNKGTDMPENYIDDREEESASGSVEGENSVVAKNIDVTQPRRSSRPPKKKPWLLELERERDSKGEDSGRESGKKLMKRDNSASSDDLNSDEEGISEDGLSEFLTTGKCYGRSPKGVGDVGSWTPSKRGRGSGRGRGRPRGRPPGRSSGAIRRKQTKAGESSSNTSEDDDDSQSLLKRKKKINVGSEFSDDNDTLRSAGRGKGMGRGRRSVGPKSKKLVACKGYMSSDSESDTNTDIQSSQDSGKNVKSIKQNKPAKQIKQKTTAVHGEGLSSDSSEDDLPLTMIKLLPVREDNNTKDKKDDEVQKFDLAGDAKITQSKLKAKTSPSDRKPILQSMYEISAAAQSTVKQTKSPSKKKPQRRKVRGHREDDGNDDSQVIISSDTENEHDDEDDDDDPNKLWCICNKPYNNRFMISCDGCNQWYHGSCVGISRKQGKEIAEKDEKWLCTVCQKAEVSLENIQLEGKSEIKPEKPEMKHKDMEVEAPLVQASANTDADQELMIAVSDEDHQVQGSKLHKTKMHEYEKDKSTKSEETARDVNETQDVNKNAEGECHPKETSKNEGDGNKVEPSAEQDNTWIMRKKDSEKKLEAMQKKLKALKAKKEKRPEKAELKSGNSTTRHGRKDKPKKSKVVGNIGQSAMTKCIRSGCSNSVMADSVYCSEDCIAKYAEESLRVLQQERERNYGSRSVEGNTDRVVVMERKTSKIVTGPAAPTEKTLGIWLEKHPTFEVLLPEQQNISSKKKEEKRNTSGKKHSSGSHFRERLSQEHDREKNVQTNREKHELANKKPERKLEDSPPSTSGPNPVRISVRKALKDYLSNRANEVDDIMLSNAEIKRVALDIEEHLYKLYREVNSKYKHKFKHILVNIRDTKNKGLFRKILHGQITPHHLVRMSSDALASKEIAQWQEEDTQQDLDLLDVDVSPNKGPSSANIVSPTVTVLNTPQAARKQEEKKPKFDSTLDFFSGFMFDTTAQHKNHLFDVNCKICTGKMPAPEEMPKATDGRKKVKFCSTSHTSAVPAENDRTDDQLQRKDYSTNSSATSSVKEEVATSVASTYADFQPVSDNSGPSAADGGDQSVASSSGIHVSDVITQHVATSSVNSTSAVQPSMAYHQVDEKPISTAAPGSNSAAAPVQMASKQKLEPSLDPRLSRSAQRTTVAPDLPVPKMKPRFPSPPAGVTSIWKGHLNVQDVAEFPTAAFLVSGNGDMLSEDLPETIAIMGRLPPENVYDYLSRLKGAHASNREICVLQLVPSLDDDKSYMQLYNYLNARNRCGVVGAMGRVIKDLYIIPLPSFSAVPAVLMPFDGPGLEFPRPHMLLCIVVKSKPKHVASPKQTTKDLQSARTWMYAERPAGEGAHVKSHQVQSTEAKPAPIATKPAVTSKRVDPRLLYSVQHSAQQLPKPTPAVQEPASSTAVSAAHATDASSSSEEETDFSEVNINDPIVKQYAKVNPKKLESEEKIEAYTPPEDDPYDPFSSFADEQNQMASAGVDSQVPTSKRAEMPQSSQLVTTTVGSSTPISTILDELTKSKPQADISATILATLAATTASQSVEEHRSLLLELNKKVEEQRQILEKQRLETLRSQESLTSAVTLLPHTTVTTLSSLRSSTDTKPLSLEASVLHNEDVSSKLNIARRRLAQKCQNASDRSTPPPVSEQPKINPGLASLPPALQTLLAGPNLDNLKKIISSVSTAQSQGKQTVSYSQGNDQTKAKTQEEEDELEAALNDPGGLSAVAKKGVSSDDSALLRQQNEVSLKNNEQTADDSVSKRGSAFGCYQTVIPGLGGDTDEHYPPACNPLSVLSVGSSTSTNATSEPFVLSWLRQPQTADSKTTNQSQSESKKDQNQQTKYDVSYQKSDGYSNKKRITGRNEQRGSSYILIEDDLEEGEIPDHPSSDKNRTNKTTTDRTALENIPLPSDIPLPSSSEKEASEGKSDTHSLDKHSTGISYEKKDSGSWRSQTRSHSRDRHRHRTRSRSRDRSRRSRSRSRGHRGHSRSRSRDRSRHCRRSRSPDRYHRSRDRPYRRSRSRERNLLPKRKRSLSSEKSSHESGEKKPKTLAGPAGEIKANLSDGQAKNDAPKSLWQPLPEATLTANQNSMDKANLYAAKNRSTDFMQLKEGEVDFTSAKKDIDYRIQLPGQNINKPDIPSQADPHQVTAESDMHVAGASLGAGFPCKKSRFDSPISTPSSTQLQPIPGRPFLPGHERHIMGGSALPPWTAGFPGAVPQASSMAEEGGSDRDSHIIVPRFPHFPDKECKPDFREKQGESSTSGPIGDRMRDNLSVPEEGRSLYGRPPLFRVRPPLPESSKHGLKGRDIERPSRTASPHVVNPNAGPPCRRMPLLQDPIEQPGSFENQETVDMGKEPPFKSQFKDSLLGPAPEGTPLLPNPTTDDGTELPPKPEQWQDWDVHGNNANQGRELPREHGTDQLTGNPFDSLFDDDNNRPRPPRPGPSLLGPGPEHLLQPEARSEIPRSKASNEVAPRERAQEWQESRWHGSSRVPSGDNHHDWHRPDSRRPRGENRSRDSSHDRELRHKRYVPQDRSSMERARSDGTKPDRSKTDESKAQVKVRSSTENTSNTGKPEADVTAAKRPRLEDHADFKGTKKQVDGDSSSTVESMNRDKPDYESDSHSVRDKTVDSTKNNQATSGPDNKVKTDTEKTDVPSTTSLLSSDVKNPGQDINKQNDSQSSTSDKAGQPTADKNSDQTASDSTKSEVISHTSEKGQDKSEQRSYQTGERRRHSRERSATYSRRDGDRRDRADRSSSERSSRFDDARDRSADRRSSRTSDRPPRSRHLTDEVRPRERPPGPDWKRRPPYEEEEPEEEYRDTRTRRRPPPPRPPLMLPPRGEEWQPGESGTEVAEEYRHHERWEQVPEDPYHRGIREWDEEHYAWPEQEHDWEGDEHGWREGRPGPPEDEGDWAGRDRAWPEGEAGLAEEHGWPAGRRDLPPFEPRGAPRGGFRARGGRRGAPPERPKRPLLRRDVEHIPDEDWDVRAPEREQPPLAPPPDESWHDERPPPPDYYNPETDMLPPPPPHHRPPPGMPGPRGRGIPRPPLRARLPPPPFVTARGRPPFRPPLRARGIRPPWPR